MEGTGSQLSSDAAARLAARAADDKKARDIVVLDVRRLTTVADYFVVCSGGTALHVRAIADGVREKLAEAGRRLLHVEGYEPGRWVLLDYGDVVVHVFMEQDRSYYKIERLWADAESWDWAAAEADATVAAPSP